MENGRKGSRNAIFPTKKLLGWNGANSNMCVAAVQPAEGGGRAVRVARDVTRPGGQRGAHASHLRRVRGPPRWPP